LPSVRGRGHIAPSASVGSPRANAACNHEPASDVDRQSAAVGAQIASTLSLSRVAVGVVLATAIALAARRVRALSPGGGAAAVAVGTAAVAAGWAWGTLLVAYFVSSVSLTHFRATAKAVRTGGIVSKGGPRDATQVLANGGAFALAALLWAATGWDGWRALGAGALAAAASDTWGTEIGTLLGRAPRSIVSWRRVPAGTSGGVSPPGIAAAFLGSLGVALAALALGWPSRMATAAFAGGIAGSTIDSLVGATVQERRWCDRCNTPTERAIHTCEAPTRVVGGIPGLDNDAVNALSTIAGGLLALALAA
jgi:uncharacterized protein (TIGR00297 family)